ncbi:MAG: hypothetical protein KTU85_07475 [Acidimicrobiia bacterium]|nr:hypothetical protein [Acidimicrobiia bacterium]MCY4456814.1 hypothetical protein [Acidimicrobiaceae bacterium]
MDQIRKIKTLGTVALGTSTLFSFLWLVAYAAAESDNIFDWSVGISIALQTAPHVAATMMAAGLLLWGLALALEGWYNQQQTIAQQQQTITTRPEPASTPPSE